MKLSGTFMCVYFSLKLKIDKQKSRKLGYFIFNGILIFDTIYLKYLLSQTTRVHMLP